MAVSTQDLTVFMQGPTTSEYFKVIMERQQAQDATLIILAAPRISNVATQILNHAAGQAFQETSSTRFQQMQTGAGSAALQALSDIADVEPRKLAQKLDDVVGRRNNQYIHFVSPAALEAEVEQCVGLIKNNPGLEETYHWECFVIKNYSEFCKQFPHLKVACSSALQFVACLQATASTIVINCCV
jgi:hypothetical protein